MDRSTFKWQFDTLQEAYEELSAVLTVAKAKDMEDKEEYIQVLREARNTVEDAMEHIALLADKER